MASRGGLVAHPHFLPPPAGSAPGSQVLACGAAGFTPFHNLNCPHGYIVATSAWLCSPELGLSPLCCVWFKGLSAQQCCQLLQALAAGV